jgi:hypothetical protein
MMLPLNDDDRLLIKIGVILLTICAPALMARRSSSLRVRSHLPE